MKRLTSTFTRWDCACKHKLFLDEYKIADRLAAIEDILGDEYDLDRLKELMEADRVGHCVVFDLHYPVASEYYKDEDGRFIRETSGVVSATKTEAATRPQVKR